MYLNNHKQEESKQKFWLSSSYFLKCLGPRPRLIPAMLALNQEITSTPWKSESDWWIFQLLTASGGKWGFKTIRLFWESKESQFSMNEKHKHDNIWRSAGLTGITLGSEFMTFYHKKEPGQTQCTWKSSSRNFLVWHLDERPTFQDILEDLCPRAAGWPSGRAFPLIASHSSKVALGGLNHQMV